MSLDRFPNAPVVFNGSNFVVQDVSALMPGYGKYPDKTQPICKVIFHHTGGGTGDPVSTVKFLGNFFVAPAKKASNGGWLGRGWPGFAYHVFIPYNPLKTADGKHIVYKTQAWDEMSYHTANANKCGVGVVFQGSFTNTKHPSVVQKDLAPRVWNEWLKPKFGLKNTNLKGHFDYTKPDCPGPYLKEFVRNQREQPDGGGGFGLIAAAAVGFLLLKGV
jgi:hypothetical protein